MRIHELKVFTDDVDGMEGCTLSYIHTCKFGFDPVAFQSNFLACQRFLVRRKQTKLYRPHIRDELTDNFLNLYFEFGRRPLSLSD